MLLTTRKIFHECKLVHADLSEYNILYHIEPSAERTAQQEDGHGHLYIIDVSQSVEHDHPHAFDFLRSDLHNVEEFFARRGARTLGLRAAFEFVTLEDLGDEPAVVLQRRLESDATEQDDEDNNAADSHDGAEDAKDAKNAADDAVFMNAYIPRTLNEVFDPERDVGALSRGEGAKLIYKDTIGIVAPREREPHTKTVSFAGDADAGPGQDVAREDSSDSEDDGDGSESDDGSDEEQDGDLEDRKPRGHRHEDREAKKVRSVLSFSACSASPALQERKKAVKADAREKRKHKIPKAEKKRKVKNSARGK